MSFQFFDDFDFLTDGEVNLKISGKYFGDKDMLPFYYYDVFQQDRFIGRISMRIGSNFHSYYNGNIGYEIEENFRGRSYALKACRLVLPIAKAHGMSKIFLTCEENNIPSYKNIERLGGELIEIIKPPKTYFAYRENMGKQRIYKLYI